jgi:hypothetical protein
MYILRKKRKEPTGLSNIFQFVCVKTLQDPGLFRLVGGFCGGGQGWKRYNDRFISWSAFLLWIGRGGTDGLLGRRFLARLAISWGLTSGLLSTF